MKKIIRIILQAQLGRNIEVVSRYRIAKAFYLASVTLRQTLTDSLLIGAGVVVAGLGLKSLLLPNHFIDGGVTGISLLVSAVTQWELPMLIVLINIPFMLMAYKQIGRAFALKSMLAIAGLALAVVAIPYPIITTDKLLIATFGGFFLGAGIGLSIRGGAVIDGTEVLAIYLSRRSSLSVGDVILVFNLIVFSVAAYLLSLETAMYAMLTYLAASKTVDFIIEGLEEFVSVTIISSHHEEVIQFITDDIKAGVTVYAGKQGYGKRGVTHQSEIIFTVVTRLEVARLQNGVERIDPNAFIVMNNVRNLRGGATRKRAVDMH